MPSDLRVLIADDMLPMRNLLKMMLRKFGVKEFIMAEDGQEAINLFTKAVEKGNRPDLVLLDIDMPKVSGLEALQQLREIDSRVFITMVSANSAEESVTEAKLHTVNGFLVKPIRSIQMEALLRGFQAYQKSQQ